MRKSLLAFLFMLMIPFLLTQDGASSHDGVGAAAFAGHTNPGGYYCTCGQPNCITEPGECGDGNLVTAPKLESEPKSDYSSGILLILVAFLVVTRINR